MMGVVLSLYLALNSLPSIVRTFLFGAWNTGFAYGLLARVNSSINRILKGELKSSNKTIVSLILIAID